MSSSTSSPSPDDTSSNSSISIIDPDTPLPSIEADEPEELEHHRTRHQTRLAAQRRAWLKAQVEIRKYCEKLRRKYRSSHRNTTISHLPPKKVVIKLVTKTQRIAEEEMENDDDESDDGTEYDFFDFQTPPPRKINLITNHQRQLAVSWSPKTKERREESVRAVSVVAVAPKKIVWKPYRSSKFRGEVVTVVGWGEDDEEEEE